MDLPSYSVLATALRTAPWVIGFDVPLFLEISFAGHAGSLLE